mmetsp:Transcript_38024/g.101302  ORF Transcript_38024/g.101302 Transcript_38024/m.101302 type:complete len:227 (+) Transcript_38024:155-835(+)
MGIPVCPLWQFKDHFLSWHIPDGDLHVFAPRCKKVGARRPSKTANACGAAQRRSFLEILDQEDRRCLVLASHSEEFSTRRESDSVHNVIKENQPRPIALSLVDRHPPNHDLHFAVASFVCHQAACVVRTTTSKHVTQRREGQAAHVAIVLQFSDVREIRNRQQHDPVLTRTHCKDHRAHGNRPDISIHRRGRLLTTSTSIPQGHKRVGVGHGEVRARGGETHSLSC